MYDNAVHTYYDWLSIALERLELRAQLGYCIEKTMHDFCEHQLHQRW